MRRHSSATFAMGTIAGLWILAVSVPTADSKENRQKGTKAALNTPRLQLFQGDGTNFVLVDDLYYEIKKTNKIIRVPSGFVTDFASVPWYARSFISVLGRHSIPAIVHDYLYWEQRCTQDQADTIIEGAMVEYGSSTLQRWIVYYSLKLRGSGAWNENKEDRKKGLIRILDEEHKNPPLNMDWNSYRQYLHHQGITEPRLDPVEPKYCKLPSE